MKTRLGGEEQQRWLQVSQAGPFFIEILGKSTMDTISTSHILLYLGKL